MRHTIDFQASAPKMIGIDVYGSECLRYRHSLSDQLASEGVNPEEMTRDVAIPALESVAWQSEAVSLLTKPIVVITAGVLIAGLGIALASPFVGVVVQVIAIALAGFGGGLIGVGIENWVNGFLDAVSQQYSTVAQEARDLLGRVKANPYAETVRVEQPLGVVDFAAFLAALAQGLRAL